MAATKSQIPPVNLKDRIAALQQRNTGSSQHESKHTASYANPSGVTGSLRDKIASFEKQGAVPVPRGSFGLGAPPVDDGSSRRRGEMMGNRVPGLSRPIAPVPVHPSRVASPEPPGGRMRSVSADLHISSPPLRSPSPTLSMDGDTLSQDVFAAADGTTARHPSTSRTHTTRRSVSDMLPRSTALHALEDPLLEGDEEVEVPAPVIVVSLEPPPADAAQPGISLDDADGQDEASTSTVVLEVTEAQSKAEASSLIPAESAGSLCDEFSAAEEKPQPALDVSVQDSSDSPTARLPSLAEQSPEAVPNNVDMSDTSSVDREPTPKFKSIAEDVIELELLPTSGPDMVSTAAGHNVADVTTSNEMMSPESSRENLQDDDIKGDSSAEGDMVSMTERTSASSTAVSTPNDHVVFPSIELVQRKITDPEELDELADQSLALDTSDAVIVREPARIVSPVVTRAVLVPVPQGLSPSSPTSPPSSTRPTSLATASTSPYIEPSLTPKTKTGSFRAVVHRKVAEGSADGSRRSMSPPAQGPPRLEPPASPGFSDLADLLADAAMLEQQLSGLGSPRAVEAAPVVRTSLSSTHVREIEPARSAPERPPPIIELSAPEYPSIPEVPETGDDDRSSSQYESLQEFPSTAQSHIPEPVTPPSKERMRSRILSDTPPPVPPKSPRPRYFSTLITRKPSANGMLSMPGAYPRNSVCSEMSEDDSVLVSTPPSPRFESFGSDTSSVRSSSRSWKMPKRSLSRATSFADRLWHKKGNRNTVIVASPGKQHLHVGRPSEEEHALNIGYSEDDAHLSPSSVPPRTPSPKPTLPKLNLSASLRPQNGPSPTERPTSWVSISSTGSGGFDSALFDAFPSVPSGVPSNPSFPSQSDSSSYLSPAGYLGSSDSANRRPAAQSSHQKGHSALV